MTRERLNLSDLKAKTPADLLAMAEEWEIENAPSMRKGEMMFSILKEHAEEGYEIGGDGVLELGPADHGILPDLSEVLHLASPFALPNDKKLLTRTNWSSPGAGMRRDEEGYHERGREKKGGEERTHSTPTFT